MMEEEGSRSKACKFARRTVPLPRTAQLQYGACNVRIGASWRGLRDSLAAAIWIKCAAR